MTDDTEFDYQRLRELANKAENDELTEEEQEEAIEMLNHFISWMEDGFVPFLQEIRKSMNALGEAVKPFAENYQFNNDEH